MSRDIHLFGSSVQHRQRVHWGTEKGTTGKCGIWTAGKDGKIVNWDERSGSAGQVIAGKVVYCTIRLAR
jgi:hypothetical protein